jgi:hypothetical protein
MNAFSLIALAAAIYFAKKVTKQPRLGVILATIAWSSYTVYEFLIAAELLCDAKCNIRVDLLLIWPFLLIVTLFGVYFPGQWTLAGKAFRVIGLSAIALISVLIIGMFFELNDLLP